MKTEDIFITDYEIEAAFKFISSLEADSNPAIHALGKTFITNTNTMGTISKSAVGCFALEPAGLVILASCFYIIGLTTGFARSQATSLEALLGLTASPKKNEEESK